MASHVYFAGKGDSGIVTINEQNEYCLGACVEDNAPSTNKVRGNWDNYLVILKANPDFKTLNKDVVNREGFGSLVFISGSSPV